MIHSPNDMDPPDYVVGDFPEEALYEAIYEKFPWLEDVDEAVGLLDLPKSIRAGGVDEMLKFVIEKAHDGGVVDAQRDAGEYIHFLENKTVELEEQNIILKNQRDRMVQVNLGTEKGLAPQTDQEWLNWEG